MALVNSQTGEYLKVTGMQFDFALGNHHINYILFKDLEQRQRYESGVGEYEQYQTKQYNGIGHIETALSAITNGIDNIKNTLLTACYIALKADMFSSWGDA